MSHLALLLGIIYGSVIVSISATYSRHLFQCNCYIIILLIVIIVILLVIIVIVLLVIIVILLIVIILVFVILPLVIILVHGNVLLTSSFKKGNQRQYKALCVTNDCRQGGNPATACICRGI
jgi:hypothetical protein